MENILRKIEKLSVLHDFLTPDVIREKDVKPGLRNPDGSGVVVGITTKGRVEGYERITNKSGRTRVRPVDGKLYYCGYDVEKLVEALEDKMRFGYEETSYLLLTGELPNKNDLNRFTSELTRRRALSRAERRIILEEVTNENQMYALHSIISHMARHDQNADSTNIHDVTRQCMYLIAKFPSVVAHNYHVMRFNKGSDLMLKRSRPELSIAENFLYMLKGTIPDEYEAHIFDLSLILHAEHGGGNNSTFTVRVVTSSGANTYMAISAGIASLSGHFHGGANESVIKMMTDLKKDVKKWDSEKEIQSYCKKLLEKKAGDKSGKIYGFGHAVYTRSDPRAIILKNHAKELAKRKNHLDDFYLYDLVEKSAKKILSERTNKIICSNVDYYSGFVYQLLGIPRELYTPIFAMSRVSGWCAHRMEQLIQGKIIRPAYLSVDLNEAEYVNLEER